GFDSEVDHHDRVFLDDPEKHDQSDESVKIEFLVEKHKREECAKNRGRQTRKNGNWMDETLIKNAEYDVDHQNCDDEQNRQILKRFLEFLHRALETCSYTGRHTQLANGFVHSPGSLTQRGA